jgi:CDGSH-type Zn-finger protein
MTINTREREMRHTESLPAGSTVAVCRCWQSDKFPYCDGTHRKHNAETGDNVGPAIITAVPAELAENKVDTKA